MPEINGYSDYDEFKGPGLYRITNKSSATFLDQPEPAANVGITGVHEHGSNHEKWQIAAVGETKYVIICRETGMYVCAIETQTPETRRPVKSSQGFPDLSSAHWKIEKPDAQHPELTQFTSVKYQGDVLTLQNGSDKEQTPVLCSAQNNEYNGQKWLLKKISG